MIADDLKLFLHGLPPDCQENDLKDFLEGVCGFPGAVTKVSIPTSKTFAFVTLIDTEVANFLLRNTLLYCDGDGQFYLVKACPYVKQHFRKKPLNQQLPETKGKIHTTEITHPKPVKYSPPEHVHQIKPDYSMLLFSKQKRKRRKGDDLTVWFGGVGSTSCMKRPKRKKKKKQASKLEVHKNESFQFGSLHPENSTDSTGVVDPVIPVHVSGSESGTQEGNVPAVEVVRLNEQKESFQFGNQYPESECCIANVTHATHSTALVVEPVLHVHGTGPESGKQKEHVPAVHVEAAHVQDQNESFQFGNSCPESKCSNVNVAHGTDSTRAVEPLVLVHGTDTESGKHEEHVPPMEVVHVEDQNATKPSSTNSTQTQLIIDHSYLGPLCLRFTNPPSVLDVKHEILERTGLSVKNQDLYCNGKKLCDSLSLIPLLDDNQDSLTLTLCTGSLKGGVRPNETTEEGAIGGEKDPSTSQEGTMQSMETWDVKKTASWLCKIRLDEKYAAICEKEDINGRALLLLARDVNQLLSVFQLKKGPKTVLMKRLKPHSETFDLDKPQITSKPTKTMNEWTVKDLCSWLREIGIPEECLKEADEEEIDGPAFLLLRESGELQTSLKLKFGPWIVLQHELSLHEKEPNNSKGNVSREISTNIPSFSMPTDQMVKSKEPLPAADDPTSKSVTDTPPKPVVSKEEEKMLLLKNALKLGIEPSTGSQDRNECSVRSIFFQRGGGANKLEQLFNFIVITKKELTGDNPRKLWRKIIENTATWMKLLPEKDSKAFHRYEEPERFVYGPSGEEVSLRDGKVGQIFLEKLSDNEYKKCYFVIFIDKQLLQDKKTYSFSFDRKDKRSYDIKLNLNSKYHASFDANNPSLDLKWSKYFNTLPVTHHKITTSDSSKAVSTSSQSDDKPHYPQTPRPFNSEYGKKYYNEGFVLDCWETGPKDMITPVHEFKIFRVGVNSGEGDSVKKFVYETLRFACGCLNERTNGTIHFGVADEKEGQTCGYKPREIVGSSVTNKPLYNEKLTEFIDKCFDGPSRSNVHHCIRPPVFIPVKSSITELLPSDKVVIEVDIEPSYSLCEGEVFKAGFKGLDRGNKVPTAFVRRGSETKQIVEVADMEEYLKNHLPRLDKERKMREGDVKKQGMEMQESCRNLFVKLRRLLCANKKTLDSSVYPILVLSKPDASMNQEILDKTFRFIQKINWLTIFDFDDQGSDSNGLCQVFKSGPATPQFDIHEAEDYEKDDKAIESIYYKTHWIFGNGYAKLGKEAAEFKEWNKSKRKRGLSKVIQSIAETIPETRAVVLFLLLSKEYQSMADTFKEFVTYLGGSNQMLYVAETSETVTDWEKTLSISCLEEHELRERGVVGMSWNEFQECMQQMVWGTDQDQRYVTMATGSPYPLGNVSFNGIEIVSAKECEELNNFSSEELQELSSKEEEVFYKGYSVTWMNFWFTDAGKNHVLRRDNYSELRNLIEKPYFPGTEGRVQTITIYHHIGAGASTMTRQALWDFRCNPQFPYRCAVVTKIDDSTCKELLQLRKIGYGEGSEARLPPVLALVEDTDDFLFRELRSQVVEHASKIPKTDVPVCVFLYCKPTQKPLDCHMKEQAASVFLEQHLSQKEVDWFKHKYTEMKKKAESHRKDPKQDFENYANENLISFMIMKENYNPKYASRIVERNLDLVTRDELTLLEYTSLLSIYNRYPVFVSCFDTLMLSSSLLRKRIFRDWVEDLTHSARIFLREVDCSTHFGTGKAIAIVHPIIAGELLDQIAERKQTTVSQITLDFLKSPLLQSQGKSFTSTYLLDGANRMLKHRKKYEYGDDVQTKFSPLIEKILYVKDTGEGKKEPTEQSIHEAADVLREGLDKFKDPMLAQQMARVFYVNAAAFCESRIDECFDNAFAFCNQAIQMNPNNSFLFDTMGRIHEGKMKVLYGSIREENRMIEIEKVTPILPLAFSGMKWFQKSLEASVDYENKYGFHGELSVMFYLLDVLHCIEIFRGQEGLKLLQGYLAYCQEIPPKVQSPWSEFHESIRDLRNRYSHCMEGLAEDFTICKGKGVEAKVLPKQLARFKAQYFSYFGGDNEKWKAESPEERWEYRWQKINQYLAGDIFFSVFRIDRINTAKETSNAKETLELLRKLAHENYCEPIHADRYKDLLLFVTTSMALHSPYAKSSIKSAQLVQEYREIYQFVEKLFALEECDEGYKRLYAHLLKVMFLWPRKDLELSDYPVQDFYDALKKLKTRWEIKRKGHIDADKILKQNVYKYMSFKKAPRQFTTLFYLGKGTGLDVFVHINELVQSRGSLDWEDRSTKSRLKRLTGVVESKNVIRVKNPLDQSRMIDIYYSPFREGGFSKEEVSCYVGFSWQGPIALDVKYTNADHVKHSLESSDPVSDDQIQFSLPKYGVVTYEEYTSRMEKLMKKLSEIDTLKEKKRRGVELDENQKKKISKEVGFKRQLQELKQSLDALGVLEEEIFD
ncbi:sterile alpha motif domain-containing protein 9-like [Oculina patagonica]